MEPILEPGDVFLTRGRSLLSLAVRVFTRKFGEKRTVVNHVGLVVEGGTMRTTKVVEALITVRRHRGIWTSTSWRLCWQAPRMVKNCSGAGLGSGVITRWRRLK